MRSALLLLFCSVWFSVASAGQWRYSTETDRMSGGKVEHAEVGSENSLSLRSPYQGRNYGAIYVRRHPKYGLDVMVQIEQGQILCRSYDPCAIMVRFGDGKPQTFTAVPPADHSSTLLFFTNPSRFIALARKHRRILVQLPIYQHGEQVLEFAVPVELVWK